MSVILQLLDIILRAFPWAAFFVSLLVMAWLDNSRTKALNENAEIKSAYAVLAQKTGEQNEAVNLLEIRSKQAAQKALQANKIREDRERYWEDVIMRLKAALQAPEARRKFCSDAVVEIREMMVAERKSAP